MATVISSEPVMVNSKTTYTIPDCGIQAVLSWLCVTLSSHPSGSPLVLLSFRGFT